jgi:hypothetical protein
MMRRRFAPGQTTTFELQVTATNGQVYSFWQTVNVSGGAGYSINFGADDTTLNRGECTTLRWDVQGVQAVYLNGNGVAGVSTTQVCPNEDTIYTLVVVRNDGSQDSRQVRIQVDNDEGDGDDDDGDDGDSNPDGTAPDRIGAPRIDWFKVDKNTIGNGSCVELDWRVSDAHGVNISRSGAYIVQGAFVDDDKKDCPPGPGTYDYTLEAYGDRGNTTHTLTVEVRP